MNAMFIGDWVAPGYMVFDNTSPGGPAGVKLRKPYCDDIKWHIENVKNTWKEPESYRFVFNPAQYKIVLEVIHSYLVCRECEKGEKCAYLDAAEA